MDTPFLDRAQPLPPPGGKRRRTLRLALGAALGAAIELAGIHYGWFDRLGAIALAFLPCYYAAITVHELGHLAAALAAGFRWREFAAGPLVVRREANGIRWRLVPGRILAGGQVQAVPETADDLRRRFFILLAGGPAATALVFALAPLLPGGPWTATLCLANALAAATSWLPYYTGGYVTDAKGMLLLGRGGPEGELLRAMLYVMAMDAQGIRPRDWPLSVSGLASTGRSPLAAAASVLRIARALDLGDPAVILAVTERSLPGAARAAPLHRRMICESAAYVQGIYRQNAVLATAWLDDARKVRGIVAEADWDADSEGAIAWAEGRRRDARAHFARALTRLDRLPGRSGAVEASRDRLSRLIQACADAVAS